MLIPPRAPASPPYEPRLVCPALKKSGDLGVRLVGGNAVGIFIHSVERWVFDLSLDKIQFSIRQVYQFSILKFFWKTIRENLWNFV